MCTLTWRVHSGGYEIFFNRDERRNRLPAVAPAILRLESTAYIAPLDGDFGGTWVAVNEFGLSFCLLNGFPERGASLPERDDYTSRGRVPLSLVASPTALRAGNALRKLPLERFRPFELVVLAPGRTGLVARWSGRSIDLQMEPPADPPLVSSSFYSEEVRRNRVAVFRALQREPGPGPTAMHLDYHRRHDPEAGPYSPCMHRDEAETVSFSWIDVDDRQIRFHYAPHSPCLARPGAPTTLARRPQ